jgi:hypothetical protein
MLAVKAEELLKAGRRLSGLDFASPGGAADPPILTRPSVEPQVFFAISCKEIIQCFALALTNELRFEPLWLSRPTSRTEVLISASISFEMEARGFEPLTSSLQSWRSTN